jgi:hypothetical protein
MLSALGPRNHIEQYNYINTSCDLLTQMTQEVISPCGSAQVGLVAIEAGLTFIAGINALTEL